MKNRKKYSGFGVVYSYTVKSHMKSRKFILSTILIGLIFIIGICVAIILTSKPKKEKKFEIDKVYVCDETGLGVPDYAAYVKFFKDEKLGGVSFETKENGREFAEQAKDGMDDFILVIQSENEDKFLIELIDGRKAGSEDESDLSVLGDAIQTYFRNYLYEKSGLDGEELVQLLMPVMTNVGKIGVEENEGKEIVEIIAVFFSIMSIYFMVIFYGVGVCSEVSMEKTSKLTEQLLVSVSPDALVSGKILGTITASIVQFLIWLIMIIAGLFGGSTIATVMYELKENRAVFYAKTLGEWFDGSGFSPLAIVLSILLFIMGLVLYLLLAGLGGSLVTKPEEAANMQIIFLIPMMISFFAVLPAITNGEGSIPLVFNLIPFTAAMSAPGTTLIGTLSVGGAFASLMIMIVLSLVILWIASRIYKGLLFFTGEKLSFKMVIGILKGSKQ